MSSYRELIKIRRSVRTYRDESIDPEIREKIETILAGVKTGPFGNPVRFVLADAGKESGRKALRLGTYGMISDAPAFVAGCVQISGTCMEDFGYCLESIILDLTSLGLATCWLGGTFNRSAFAKVMKPGKNEVIPAVTPVGLPGDRKRPIDALVRGVSGSDKRKPWNELFFSFDGSRLIPMDPLPCMGDAAAPGFDASLEAVRLSPSASNKQPWRLVREEPAQTWHFFLHRTPGYGNFGKHVRLQNMDLGIAMCHFEFVSRESGISGTWEKKDPGIMDPRGETSLGEYIVSFRPEHGYGNRRQKD